MSRGMGWIHRTNGLNICQSCPCASAPPRPLPVQQLILKHAIGFVYPEQHKKQLQLQVPTQ